MVRARKIAQSYRAHLHAAAPGICAEVDDMARAFGELWIVPRVVTATDDDELTPTEAADYLCITTAALRQLRGRLRREGRQLGVKRSGEWRYTVRELRALQVSVRRRQGGRRTQSDTPQTPDLDGRTA